MTDEERRRKNAEYARAFYYRHRERILADLREARAKRTPAEHDAIKAKHRAECRKYYPGRKERQRAANVRWRANNPERDKAARKRYYAETVKTKRYHLKKYGITGEAYDAMHAAQAGLCAICRQPETHVGRGKVPAALAVDHCHITGRVRGLLCRDCNQVLGKWRDSVEILQSAIDYLQRAKQ